MYTSVFQPVGWYALVLMRKPYGVNNKHGADDKTLLYFCKHILNIFSLFKHCVVFHKTWCHTQ